jgi:acyl-ACP thioesterase
MHQNVKFICDHLWTFALTVFFTLHCLYISDILSKFKLHTFKIFKHLITYSYSKKDNVVINHIYLLYYIDLYTFIHMHNI